MADFYIIAKTMRNNIEFVDFEQNFYCLKSNDTDSVIFNNGFLI